MKVYVGLTSGAEGYLEVDSLVWDPPPGYFEVQSLVDPQGRPAPRGAGKKTYVSSDHIEYIRMEKEEASQT